MVDLIRGASLLRYIELVRELGGEPHALLRAEGIDPAVTRDEGRFIRYTSHAAVVGAASRALDCPDFGMRLACVQGISVLGPLSVLIRNSETVALAVEAGTRFLYYSSPAEVARLERGRGSSALSLDIALPPFPDRPHAIEKGLAIVMDMFRSLIGDDFRPERVTMTHGAMSSGDIYAAVFGCEVEFGAHENSIRLDTSHLGKAVAGRDEAALALAHDYLSHIRPDESFADTIRDLTRRLLSVGDASLVSAARAMSLHPRTVQRRLSDSGTSFEQILDETRRSMAWELATTGMQASQVAIILGYAEQSSFTRACRRWYGETPRAFFARRRSSETDP